MTGGLHLEPAYTTGIPVGALLHALPGIGNFFDAPPHIIEESQLLLVGSFQIRYRIGFPGPVVAVEPAGRCW